MLKGFKKKIELSQKSLSPPLPTNNSLKVYPANTLDEENALIDLFTTDAEIEIKKAFLEDNTLIGKKINLEISASDDIDQLHKGNYPRDLPEDRRRISNFQLKIYDNLIENKKIIKNFNNYFFTNGDSRDPELAGIGGALVGSFYSIIICLLLAFPIAVLASIYLEEFAPKNKNVTIIDSKEIYKSSDISKIGIEDVIRFF